MYYLLDILYIYTLRGARTIKISFKSIVLLSYGNFIFRSTSTVFKTSSPSKLVGVHSDLTYAIYIELSGRVLERSFWVPRTVVRSLTARRVVVTSDV